MFSYKDHFIYKRYTNIVTISSLNITDQLTTAAY